MTSYDLFAISDSTKQIVNALTKTDKVELTVMYNEEQYPEEEATAPPRKALGLRGAAHCRQDAGDAHRGDGDGPDVQRAAGG